MLKSSFPHIEWDAVECVGFDLDGTLYDECEFIAQVYRPIAAELAAVTGREAVDVHAQMLERWLEKGSSYNRIFDEVLAAAGVIGRPADEAVARCIALFRSFEPRLTLPARVATILGLMRNRYSLFLVSDGSLALQQRKFAALGLDAWIGAADVVMTASCGPGGAKPSVAPLAHLRSPRLVPADKVVFCGDRDVDRDFAVNAGFQFVRVNCMRAVSE